jgi:hypothetical protein
MSVDQITLLFSSPSLPSLNGEARKAVNFVKKYSKPCPEHVMRF